MKRYFIIWWQMTKMAAISQLSTLIAVIFFIMGKIIRLLLFFFFLFSILSGAGSLAGFNREQVILFFLVFNLIDITVQFLFRGVYHFRGQLTSGNFDMDLLKPWPSFFRPIFGWTDILDLITLIPLIGYFIWYLMSTGMAVNLSGILLFVLLMINSILIGFSFHLMVCAFGVRTLSIDYLIWIYRDITNMGRFPTDIYAGGIKLFLTFVIPVVILMSVPSKALLGILSGELVLFSLFIGGLLFWLALKFWYSSLKHYSSASS